MSESRPTPAPKLAHLALLALIAVALVLRVAAALYLDYEPDGDFKAYWAMAVSMLSTGHMNDGMGNVAYYSSGYPILLVPFFGIFGSAPMVGYMVNAVLGGLSVWLTYLVARYVLPTWRWALLAAAVWAFYPVSILYPAYLAKENLMIPLLVWQLLLIFQYPTSKRPLLSALVLGLVFGFELLVGAAVLATGLLIGLAVVGYRIWPVKQITRHYRAIAALIVGCLLMVGPWLAYTAHELGKPVLATNAGFNLYLGNNPNATGYYVGIEDTPIAPEWHRLKDEMGEIKVMSHLGDLARDYIKAHPGHTVVLSMKKFVYFWWPPVQDGKGPGSFVETVMRLVWLAFYAVIVPLALVPLFRPRGLTRESLLCFGTVLLYCAPYVVTYVIYRYRLPAMPIMSVLAVYGAWQLYGALFKSGAPQQARTA